MQLSVVVVGGVGRTVGVQQPLLYFIELRLLRIRENFTKRGTGGGPQTSLETEYLSLLVPDADAGRVHEIINEVADVLVGLVVEAREDDTNGGLPFGFEIGRHFGRLVVRWCWVV